MIRTLIVGWVLCVSAAAAAEAPASAASIQEMLRITEARKLVDSMFTQLETIMRSSMQHAIKGRTISAEEQKIMDGMTTKTLAMMREELSWDKLEPLYLRVYQKTFTQEEVDGMLTFYRSPAGVAVIKKMPMVIQQTMSEMQERMGPMMQRIEAAVQETIAEIAGDTSKKR
jgi:hypothetical protein